MNNKPQEIQKTSTDSTPSPAIEAAAQSAWSRPTDTTGNTNNINVAENPMLKQTKGSGDNTPEVTLAPHVMTKPDEPGKQGEKTQPTVVRESDGSGNKHLGRIPRPLSSRNEKSILTHDAPPPTAAQEPSDASVKAALASVADSKASDTAKTVASSILKGDVKDVQKVLQELEKDPDGKKKLQELSGELKGLLGTRVTAKVDSEGKFGLEFLTQLSSQPRYEFEHGPNDPPLDHLNTSTSLFINSSRDMAAISTTSSDHSFGEPEMSSVDAGTEATRLQAIGVHGVNDGQRTYKVDEGRDRSGKQGPNTDGGIMRPSNDTKGTLVPVDKYKNQSLEITPLQY